MEQILQNIGNNLHNLIRFKFNKIQILLFLMVFFSLIYMLLDDSHFEGVNKFKEIVKEEVIKDKAIKEIKENFDNLKEFYNDTSILDKNTQKEEVMDVAAKEVETEVKNEDLDPTKVDPSVIMKYFNRLYFAIVTGCLLGYGDIYPVSKTSKLFAGLQGLLTVSLIIY
tara:strand:+ start:516 stop:1019 length:504 start_codon:yes stop_codon:yes gene_type:complete